MFAPAVVFVRVVTSFTQTVFCSSYAALSTTVMVFVVAG
jgi:hypothetical protein